jgi:putative transcriptional regulator
MPARVVNDSAVRNRIREWRIAAGQMTQAELAARCGVTRQTIIALEAGRYAPSLELAFRIARALGRVLEEVFAFDDAQETGSQKK